jgi:hypothetical protein
MGEWLFVPEGPTDRSQGGSALPRRGWRTQPRVSTLGIIKTNGSPRRGGRCCYQMNLAPIATQKSEYAIETCYHWTIGPTSALLVRRFDLAPLQGASLWVVGSQG